MSDKNRVLNKRFRDFLSKVTKSLDLMPLLSKSTSHISNPLNLTTLHKGTSKGLIKTIPNNKEIYAFIFIDDYVSKDVNELHYQFNNYNPKVREISGVASIESEHVELEYSEFKLSYLNTGSYSIKIKTTLNPGRYLIAFGFKLSGSDISDIGHTKPVDMMGPDFNIISRPININRGRGEKIIKGDKMEFYLENPIN